MHHAPKSLTLRQMPRTFNDDAQLELDSAGIEQLMALIRGSEVTPLDMRSRLREFQKRFFPKSASVGRGKRTLYPLREVHELAIAFELADMDLSTPRCIAIVEQNRSVIERICTDAWDALRATGDDEVARAAATSIGSHGYLIHVAPTNITHDRGAYVGFGSIGQSTAIGSPLRHSRVTVDVMTIVADISAALMGDSFRYKQSEIDQAYVTWAVEVHGDAVGEWTKGEMLARDQRVAR